MIEARTHIRWALAYWISRTLTTLGSWLPTGFWYALARPVTEVCFVVMWPHRRRLIDNLVPVVGKDAARETARRVFHAFSRYVIDFYQLPNLGRKTVERRVQYDSWPRLHEALSEGKGTVFVTVHLGQAEMGAATVANNGHRVNVIAETFNYPPMDGFIQGLRRKLGMTIIPANKAIPGLLRCLKRGEVLAMLFDAVRPGEGMKVRFLGGEAEMSSAPARIALRTGARVLTTVVSRDPDDPQKLIPIVDFDVRYEPTGDEETDVRALTQAMATSFERFVQRFPDQWFAFRPVWTRKPGDVAADDAEPETEAWRLQSLRAAVKIGRYLPRWAAYGLARIAGDAAYKYRHGARADVEDNMRHVLGAGASEEDVAHHAREAFRNVSRYYVDLIRLPYQPRPTIDREVRMHDFTRLTDILDSGRGAIVATAHYGNPEMAVQVGSLLGLDILVLAEPLQPPAFAKLMTQIRSTFEPTYVDVGFSGISAALRHLRGGGCLAIAADRDVQGNGVPIDFFGTTTLIPLGAVELAARTKAAIIPGVVVRAADGFDVYFEEPLDLVSTGQPKQDAITNTRKLLARMEEWIARDPGQWFVLERFWRPVPPEPPSEPARTLPPAPSAEAQPSGTGV